MPHSRFFLDEPFHLNKEIILSGPEFHHIGVMRKEIGEIIEVVNGKNQLSTAKITNFTSKSITLKIIEITENKLDKPSIILAQAMVRPPKLDLVLEKCTELGVSEFILFKADYSETETISQNRQQRINSLLTSAIKQCGRLDLPKFSFMDNMKKFKGLDYQFLYGDLSCSSYIDLNKLQNSKNPLCFLVGPEKGFSEKEKTFLKEELKALPVKINKNILRTETAAISAISILAQLHLR